MRILLLVILFGVTAAMAVSRCSKSVQEVNKAKYVFYFIGDGMGVNQVNATEIYLKQKNGGIGNVPLNFTKFPVVSMATTYSLTNPITCSSASGTALATGMKTANGVVSMDSAKEKPLYSIAMRAKAIGRKVGVTTSVSIDHATPAVFYAHQPSRKMYYQIGTDLPKAGFDFYAGSDFLQPLDPKDSLAQDLFSIARDSGYVVVRGMEAFSNIDSKRGKVILMQKDTLVPDCIPYAIDRQDGDMTLSQITEAAIKSLNNENGFFLMVEGGKIDWACHSNDAATMVREVIDFSEAIDKAIAFYNEHPNETLIVVTADHETGGLALGSGSSDLKLNLLENQKLSVDNLSVLIKKLRNVKGNKISWDEVKHLLSDELGFWTSVELSEEDEKLLENEFKHSIRGKDYVMEKNLYASLEPMAALAVRILNGKSLVKWASGGHSAGFVPVYAIGVGAEKFMGRMDNALIPQRIAEVAGY